MSTTRVESRQDPLSRAYRDQVDVTLLEKNLRLSVEERIEQLQALLRFAEELRRAGRSLRPDRDG